MPKDTSGDAVSRRSDRERAAQRAIVKRDAGFPSYAVPEAAALLSVSPGHLYRLIHKRSFPAIRMDERYVVPAAAIEQLLDSSLKAAETVEIAAFTAAWIAGRGDAA